MKPDAKAVGLTKYYERGSKSLSNIADLYPNAMKDQSLLATFKTMMGDLDYQFTKETLIGEALEPGPYFEYHAPGDRHRYYAFFAEKEI